MLWKIYFWLLTVSYLILLGTKVGSFNTVIGIDFIITFLGIIALFGYVFKRRFFVALFWKLFFPCLIMWDIIYGLITTFQSNTQFSGIIILLSFIMITIPLIPFYIGVYRYAYVDSKLTLTQLNFKRKMKGVKNVSAPYDNSRNGNPFNQDK